VRVAVTTPAPEPGSRELSLLAQAIAGATTRPLVRQEKLRISAQRASSGHGVTNKNAALGRRCNALILASFRSMQAGIAIAREV